MNVVGKIREKWTGLSLVAKSSIAMVIASFFQKGLSAISGPIFTRIMPQSEYGVLSTFTAWQSIIFVVATLNMQNGVFNNGMTEFKEDRDSFLFSLLMLSNTSTLITSAVYLIFRQWIDPVLGLSPIFMLIMFFYMIFNPAYGYWIGRQRYEYKYKSVLVVMVVVSTLSTLLSILFVLLVADSQKATVKVVTAESVTIIASIILYIYICIRGKLHLKIKYWVYALKINLPLIPHYLSMYILSSSDRIMISNLVGTSKTAIYNVAYNVASLVLILWNSVDAAYAPWIYQKMDERNYTAIKKRANGILFLFAGIAVLASLFAPEVIRILAPSNYYSGIYVIPSVVAGVYFTALSSLFLRVELYLKKSGTVMCVTVSSALLNLLLNYIFIQIYDFYAAGYTTLVCYLLVAVFHGINIKRLGYGEAFDYKTLTFISIGVCTVISVISVIYPYTALRYILIIIICIVAIIKRNDIKAIVKKIA